MNIGTLIVGYRHHKEIGVREMAAEIGVSAATLNRIELGEAMDGSTMFKIIVWLFH